MKNLFTIVTLVFISFNSFAGDGASGGGPRITAGMNRFMDNDHFMKELDTKDLFFKDISDIELSNHSIISKGRYIEIARFGSEYSITDRLRVINVQLKNGDIVDFGKIKQKRDK